MIVELFIVPVKRGPEPESCLEVVYGLPCLALGPADIPKGAVASVDQRFFAFAQEIDRL